MKQLKHGGIYEFQDGERVEAKWEPGDGDGLAAYAWWLVDPKTGLCKYVVDTAGDIFKTDSVGRVAPVHEQFTKRSLEEMKPVGPV